MAEGKGRPRNSTAKPSSWRDGIVADVSGTTWKADTRAILYTVSRRGISTP